MRALGLFVAAIAAAVLLAAALAYPLYQLVHPLQPQWRFDRIAARAWIPIVVLLLIAVMRYLRLSTARDFGYGAPRPRWLRQFAVGLAAGVATMLPVTLSMLLLGLRVPPPDLVLGTIGKALLVGLGSGLAVGFAEETLFRGVIQGAVVRELRRPVLAVALVSALFAAVHLLTKTQIPHEQVTSSSGLALLAGALANFAAPTLVLDRLLALFAVGLLLGLVTWWTGSIALAVGLHAGWVWMMRATVGATELDGGAPLAWLISRDDGYTGWLVLAWTLLITLVAVAMRGRFRPWRRTD